jgi:hypothetical protein
VATSGGRGVPTIRSGRVGVSAELGRAVVLAVLAGWVGGVRGGRLQYVRGCAYSCVVHPTGCLRDRGMLWELVCGRRGRLWTRSNI